MKTFAFFSPKGGVGKTTLLLFLAAYLAYVLRKKVKVYDLEAPEYRVREFRNNDMKLLTSNSSNPLTNYVRIHEMPKEIYDIECMGRPINTYSKNDRITLVQTIQKDVNEGKYDYGIIDFPAGFSECTPVTDISRNGLIDLMYIPSSTEAQERRAAFIAAKELVKMGQDIRLLWNNVSAAYLKYPEILDDAEKLIVSKIGVRYSAVRIKTFPKAKQDSGVRCFTRTTVCWPERYIQMACPDLIPLFDEIVAILDTKE